MAIQERKSSMFQVSCDYCDNFLGEGATRQNARQNAFSHGACFWSLWNGLEYVYRWTCRECTNRAEKEGFNLETAGGIDEM